MDVDFSVDKPRIARLTGPNYRPWSIQVQRLLLSKGLWSVVRLGVEPPRGSATGEIEPEEGASLGGTSGFIGPEGPVADCTEVKDVTASTIIIGLCVQSTLQHVLLLITAKEQWETLKSLYSPLGLQQLSAKIQAFTAYRPSEGSTMITEISTYLSTL